MNDLEEWKVQQEILNQKEAFLAKCSSEERPIIEAILRTKELQKRENGKVAKNLADITRQLMEADYIKFDDGISITIAEMEIANATRNTLTSNKTTFREINDIQKVVDNDITSNAGGVQIIINTNGQDLGG